MNNRINFFVRTKQGLSFGSVTDGLTIQDPDPSLTIEGPVVYSPSGSYLAVVKNGGHGFKIIRTDDYSVQLDVCYIYPY